MKLVMLHNWTTRQYYLFATAACALVAFCSWAVVRHFEWDVQRTRQELARLRHEAAAVRVDSVAVGGPLEDAGGKVAGFDPQGWPERVKAEALVGYAGRMARVHGVHLRSITVAHHPATARDWGRVTFEVTGSGAYAGLKAWQAEMQANQPALAVQQLRWQSGRNSAGLLDAQWAWVLYVRD